MQNKFHHKSFEILMFTIQKNKTICNRMCQRQPYCKQFINIYFSWKHWLLVDFVTNNQNGSSLKFILSDGQLHSDKSYRNTNCIIKSCNFILSIIIVQIFIILQFYCICNKIIFVLRTVVDNFFWNPKIH